MEPEINSPAAVKSNFAVPIAIVLAGLVIAGAIYYGDSSKINNRKSVTTPDQITTGLDQINPISANDHIRGNPSAPIIIVEYSDTECPFCARFHLTMKQIMDEYGKAGKVAWVYRHFPLDNLHSKARNEATALECANELGGNDKFWEYIDQIYAITPSNDQLDPAELPKIAQAIGLNVNDFNTCLASDKYADRIQADLENAKITGGTGTPWSIILTRDGTKYPINGAQSYATVKKIIDSLLK